jgi:hypothetical protein
MKLRDIITDQVSKGSAVGTSDDLESPRVEPGTLLEVRHVSVENRTTAYTRLVIGVADGLSFFQKEEQDSPAANNLYWTPNKFLIPAGKKLRARLAGCTAGDKIYMTYEGFLWETEPERMF